MEREDRDNEMTRIAEAAPKKAQAAAPAETILTPGEQAATAAVMARPCRICGAVVGQVCTPPAAAPPERTPLEVSCPVCHAAAGVPCAEVDGCHEERRYALAEAHPDEVVPVCAPAKIWMGGEGEGEGGPSSVEAKQEGSPQDGQGSGPEGEPTPAPGSAGEGEGEKQAPDPIRRRTLYRTMTVALPDHEIARRSLEIRRLEKRVEQAKADCKTICKPCQERISVLQGEIDDGSEQRFECVEATDYRTNTLRVVRTDTGEIVEDRALRGEERQQELPLAPAQPPAVECIPHIAERVACPTCSVPAGAPCLNASGAVLDAPHPARMEVESAAAAAAAAAVAEALALRPEVCPLDNDCSAWDREVRRCTSRQEEGGSCSTCSMAHCPDDVDCPCPLAVAQADAAVEEMVQQADELGMFDEDDEPPAEPDPDIEPDTDEPF